MADTQNYDDQWLQSAQTHSAALENTSDVKVVDFLASDYVDSPKLTMPGVEYDQDPGLYNNAKPLRFVQFRLSSLKSLYDSASSAATNANTQASAAETAARAASNVNATLEGMTVTITDRTGISRQTNIGFEIYRTYTSVAAMNADAANVPLGKFVIIATTDPTDPDNAKLYAKNAQGGFTFLSDLDQASSAAWADWLENMKPEIEDATDAANAAAGRVDTVIATANADHVIAVSDHTTADADHGIAVDDHLTADHDHNVAELDHDTASDDHTTADADHLTAVSDHTTADTDHSVAEADHTTATTDHTTAVSDHTIATQDHTTATQDHTTYTSDHAISEAQQSTFEANEAQRQQDFEDAEADRMAAMVITRCFVDVTTMCLMFVQPQADTTQYNVRNGNLIITITYDE